MERKRIIEGTWTCTSCDTKSIPGREKICPNCRSAREDEEAKFDFGERTASGASKNASVTDKTQLELAAAGADWYCAGCGSANGATALQCANCGDSDPGSRLAKKPEKPKAPQAAQPAPTPPAAKSGGKGAFGCAGCLAVGVPLVLCLGVAGWWLSRTHEATGTVASVHWSRELQVETFTPETTTGWRSDLTVRPSVLPHNGAGEVAGVDNLRGCSREEKTPEKCENKTKKVDCGTEEKCEVKDLGNGHAEETCKDVTKYCDEAYEECKDAVYDDRCTYDTYAWKPTNKAHADGNDNQPKWPTNPSTGSLDRMQRSESYEVALTYDGEQASYTPTGEGEFVQFTAGMPVVVEVNNMGAVKSVRPKK